MPLKRIIKKHPLAIRWFHWNGVLKPLRTALNTNEKIFSSLVNDSHLAKTFPVNEAVSKVRVNSNAGMSAGFDPHAWKLKLIRKPGDTWYISIDEIKAIPKSDKVFDFNCIEAWSQVTHWTGVKFSDFVKRHGLIEQSGMQYAGLITPDKGYYVGIDKRSILHPQTMLCYEMNATLANESKCSFEIDHYCEVWYKAL